jgi:predicted Zn-dependent protease
MDATKARDILTQLGHTGESLAVALLSFQGFHKLKTTGTLNAETAEKLMAPRCGMPDRVKAEGRWGIKELRYWQNIRFSFLDSKVVADAYDKAWAQWVAVCGMHATLSPAPTGSNVVATSGHIDEQYQVLAWSEMPPGSATAGVVLRQMYDDAEKEYASNLDMLVAVMCHEIGHALGLDHSTNPRDLMAPYITDIVRPQPGDVQRIQALYGPPVATPAPSPDPGPNLPPIPPPPAPAPDVITRVVVAVEHNGAWIYYEGKKVGT